VVSRTSVILFLCVCFSLGVWAETIYTVQRGDTIYSISRKYGVEPKDVIKANSHLKAEHLLVGEKIKLPTKGEAKSQPKKESPPLSKDIPTTSDTDSPPPPRKTYRVQKGDTLSKIARENKMSVSQVRELNQLSSDIIHTGQLLSLSGENPTPAPPKTANHDDEELLNTGSEVENPPADSDAPATADPHYVFVAPVKALIDSPKKLRPWEYIVVHHSGTPNGNAKIFNYYHLKIRGMENGLAYHFVIGNGTDSGDGEIEVGPRWLKQLQGGHLASDYLNEISIGICLVGDFNKTHPTTRQLASLIELINYLMLKCKSPKLIFKLHREINPRPTDCPGKFFPAVAFHKLFG